MNLLLKIEELFLVGLAVYLFRQLDYAWWWYPALFLAPDLGMIGYLAGPKIGAIAYNLAHHKAIAIGLYLLGALLGGQAWQLAGLVIFGHSSFDRLIGYGLKYPDSFHQTHLGTIGKNG